MTKRSRKKRKKKSPGKRSRVADKVRQLQYPPQFRIPEMPARATLAPPPEKPTEQQDDQQPVARPDARVAAECATCLWYLKTKFFKRPWDEADTTDDNPRVRRAIGRLNRSVEKLRDFGVEVHDPTNSRYPPGGEGMMRPIQFLPTAGLTCEMVTETVAPLVFYGDRLIQRGEVFVAVPLEQTDEPQSANQPPESETAEVPAATPQPDDHAARPANHADDGAREQPTRRDENHTETNRESKR